MKSITIHEVHEGGLPGCKYIYAPKGQAGEYAPLAANPYRGCGNKCFYCYVPLVTKQPRAEFDAGAQPRANFLNALIGDAKKYQAAGVKEQVMLSFTTDPYHPGDTILTRATLEVLASWGLGFCTLTKGGSRALRDRHVFRPKHDAFASTLTTLDDAFSKKWERDAAPASERLDTLRAFHEANIFTWVSLEPVIDVEATLDVIAATYQFVDLYKVGRVNYSGLTKTTDWKDFTLRAVELLNNLDARHYIKRDLQQYLPAGYPNVLRVRQHH